MTRDSLYCLSNSSNLRGYARALGRSDNNREIRASMRFTTCARDSRGARGCWVSVHGAVVCSRCHPPVAPELDPVSTKGAAWRDHLKRFIADVKARLDGERVTYADPEEA